MGKQTWIRFGFTFRIFLFLSQFPWRLLLKTFRNLLIFMDTVLANIVFFPNETESKQVQNGPYFIPELIWGTGMTSTNRWKIGHKNEQSGPSEMKFIVILNRQMTQRTQQSLQIVWRMKNNQTIGLWCLSDKCSCSLWLKISILKVATQSTIILHLGP